MASFSSKRSVPISEVTHVLGPPPAIHRAAPRLRHRHRVLAPANRRGREQTGSDRTRDRDSAFSPHGGGHPARAAPRPRGRVVGGSRFTGVVTSRTSGGGLSVRIRGVGSFFSSNEPLYVIDDVPINLGDGAPLRAINPGVVASIEVIKDPAGLALYGVRGANGVIVIRTKRR